MASAESVADAVAETQAVIRGIIRPTLLLVSDLDNTMVDHQDDTHEALLRFNALWEVGYANDSLLVFSTGRSPTLYKALREDVPLLTPDITIMSVGTEITYGPSLTPDREWEAYLDVGWDRSIVVEEAQKLDLKLQAESEQRPHKVSFSVEKSEAPATVEKLTKVLEERGLKSKLIYSGGADLDVLAEGAGKGQALAYLLKKFTRERREPHHTLACGDSGNDAELFTVEGANGVIVGNAMEELVHWYEGYKGGKEHIFRARERCAGGILEAMAHFHIQPSVSPRDAPIEREAGPPEPSAPGVLSLFSAQREVVEFFIYLEGWLAGTIAKGDGTFDRIESVLADDFTEYHANGEEKDRGKYLEEWRAKQGSKQGENHRLWVDRMFATELSTGVWLTKYRLCQKAPGQKRETHLHTSVLIAKANTSNGLVWLHTHANLVPRPE